MAYITIRNKTVKMPNYQNGKIYKIVNSINNKVYIGSTVVALYMRMGGHRRHARIGRQSPLHREMHSLGVDQFTMLLVRNAPCNNIEELVAIEYEVMNQFQANGITLLNSLVNGKASLDTRERNRSQRIGALSCMFKRGSIMFDPVCNRWRYKWKANGKHLQKSFSCKSWGGSWGAHQMCIVWQNNTYPLK
jgi:hypothetical protein